MKKAKKTPKKRGVKPNPNCKTHTGVKVAFRMTHEQRDMLRRAASLDGMNMTDWIVFQSEQRLTESYNQQRGG